jgi:multiple sugar transport system substrate-binding protein
MSRFGYLSRRHLLRCFVGAGGVALVAACAPAAAPTPTTAPAVAAPAAKPAEQPATKPAEPAAAKPAGSKPEVTLRQVDGNWHQGVMGERLKAFKEKNPHITVNVEAYPFAELFPKIQALVAGNQMGDTVIGFNSTASYQYFAQTNVLRSVDDLVASENFDLTQYYPQVVEGLRHQGKLYGLAFKGHPGASNLFYNENLFEAEGLALPTEDWTWQNAIEAATKMTKATTSGGRVDQFGLLWQNNIIFWRNVFQLASGAEIYSEDGRQSLVNTAPFRQAVEWMHDLQQVKKVAINPSQLTGTERDMFASGKVAMWFTLPGQKAVGNQIKEQFKWMAVIGPKGHNDLRGPLLFIDTFSVTSASKHADEAWEVVKWVTDKETGIRLGEGAGPGASGTPGGRPDVWESDRLRNHPDYRPEAQSAGIRAMELLKPYRNSWNFRDSEINSLLSNRLEAVWIGQEQPTQQYLETVHKEVQAVLERPLPG